MGTTTLAFVPVLDLSTGEVDTPVCDIPPGGAGLQLVVGPDDHIWYADPIRGAIVRVNRSR